MCATLNISMYFATWYDTIRGAPIQLNRFHARKKATGYIYIYIYIIYSNTMNMIWMYFVALFVMYRGDTCIHQAISCRWCPKHDIPNAEGYVRASLMWHSLFSDAFTLLDARGRPLEPMIYTANDTEYLYTEQFTNVFRLFYPNIF